MTTSDVLRSIPLSKLSVELLEQDLQLGSKLVQVEGSVRTTAWMIDYDALEPWKRCLIDNGDLLPSWAYWWLTLTAELAYNASWSNYSALIIQRTNSDTQSPLGNFLSWRTSPYQILPLMVEDICDALTIRSSSVGFAVAWGVNSRDFNHPVLPISCRGAILPVVDGMGILCIATDEDRSTLDIWIGDEEIER